MELGTHQGGTAAAAMLAKPKNVILVDIDMSRYYKFLSPIADKWCSENNINLCTHSNPLFLTNRDDLEPFFNSGKKKLFQTTFYKSQRKKSGQPNFRIHFTRSSNCKE